MPAEPITIALLDDHPAILHALRHALNVGVLRVVGEYLRIDTLFHGLDTYLSLEGRPIDIAVIDYSLGPDAIDGISLIQRLRTRHPGTRLVVMTAMEQDSIKTLVMTSGAHAFVGKSVRTEALSDIVLAVMRGRKIVEPPIRPADTAALRASRLPAGLADLTAREMEVFRCLVEGMSTGQIARKFVRAPSTISTQIGSLSRKLGVASINELLSQKATWASILDDAETDPKA